ncbi:MAG: PilZ domain-containing protein [Desulfobacterales bacterium]
MVSKRIEKRECERLVITGAAVRYRKDALFRKSDYSYYSYPVTHMSKGGIGFLCDDSFDDGVKVELILTVPDEVPVIFKGKVAWTAINPEKSYKYRVGVQFEPYGKKKGQNPPEILEKISAWEQKYLKQ